MKKTDEENRKSRRHGPLPRPVEELRRTRMSIFLTENESAEVRRWAEAAGENPSEYTRSILLSRGRSGCAPKKRIPELNQIAYRELARSASNLNQISRNLNMLWQSGGLPGLAEIEQIKSELYNFRVQLIGLNAESAVAQTTDEG